MMITYFEQLQTAADKKGIDLANVCRLEGVADTTLMRWRKGESTCRQGTAAKLFSRIEQMDAA